MKVVQTDFLGDHNIGMFARATDKFCLIGNPITENSLSIVKENLKVPTIRASISNTELIGMFCVANSNGIVLPKIIFEGEYENIKKNLEELGVNIYISKSRLTCIGNLILCNDKGAIISNYFSSVEKKNIEDALDVEIEYGTVAKMPVVGSSGVATNRGCLLHRDAEESEMKIIEGILKVKSDIGTANFGSPFVGSCIVANSNAALVGESTTGPEIMRLQEALELI